MTLSILEKSEISSEAILRITEYKSKSLLLLAKAMAIV